MPKCIKVYKKYAETLRRLLLTRGFLDTEYRITIDKDYVLIPIVEHTSLDLIHDIIEKYNAEIITNCTLEHYRMRKKELKPPSYDMVGDIAIVREKVVENKKEEIIETLKQLHPRLKAIYVKEYTTGIHRTAKLRLLWGNEVDHVIHKEYGLRFYIDIHNVYYNPRLSTEHRRIAEDIRNGELVIDLFCGIGGFTLHATALKRITVIANDINPYAIYCLLKSIILNKKRLKGDIILSINDAYKIHSILKEKIADRIIANLPHSSHLFWNTYNYLSHRNTILHLYSIASTEKDLLSFMEKYLERYLWDIMGVRKVLDYSPYRYIYRVDLVKL